MPHLLLLLHQQLHQPLPLFHHHHPQTKIIINNQRSSCLLKNPRTIMMMPQLYSINFFPQQQTRTPRTATVKCMANPRRMKMVAKQIQREISDMLITDKVLQHAVLPETALGADRYLSSLTTISDVEISPDLQIVKVYVSVFGDERGKEVALAGLKSKAKYVRGQLGRRMKLRLTPEVRFIEDESQERGSRVIAILDKIKNEKESDEGEDEDGDEGEDEGEGEDVDEDEDEEQSDSSDLPEDDEDYEGEEDPDEGIIYVN